VDCSGCDATLMVSPGTRAHMVGGQRLCAQDVPTHPSKPMRSFVTIARWLAPCALSAAGTHMAFPGYSWWVPHGALPRFSREGSYFVRAVAAARFQLRLNEPASTRARLLSHHPRGAPQWARGTFAAYAPS